jgi:hypothetical protein
MICWPTKPNEIKLKPGMPMHNGSAEEKLSLVNGTHLKGVVPDP